MEKQNFEETIYGDPSRQEEKLPENPTPSEKVKLASKHKERGTRFLVQGKLEEALVELDRAFVFVFSPRDEWELLYSNEDREVINRFKVPCHLNRGLCKWKLGKLEDALWDFDETLRLDPTNIKALYRRGSIYLQLVERELQKEEEKELWDPEKAEKLLSQAKHDLRRAYGLLPGDSSIIASLHAAKVQEQKLSTAIREYRLQQRKIFSFAFKKLEEKNSKEEATEEELPKLERISLDTF
ncbi:Peptidyl-prolyl cis-trans isomerase FKBP4 [Galdieria sulphuraria]|uniref:peptidylprolyl isomerase n=1 Tax=Galdieria sulphuraria TaxID=130081 RepID=M2W675_GALSU|nr:peptidylprolyl isomerase-like protein [Galdieria sulphuraria]EME31261.1 peptidylprolyl isomerase-like protein [Galdieria sulphuraria]GJD07682.1 Peptidyl-prolyl cis-trans isomerase FKBP4 [Galdieria sulphuraria]|eukprot:XP_005707781.1 peptidylprolyl isomerase-like protein [Galdieria sulphuraria]